MHLRVRRQHLLGLHAFCLGESLHVRHNVIDIMHGHVGDNASHCSARCTPRLRGVGVVHAAAGINDDDDDDDVAVVDADDDCVVVAVTVDYCMLLYQ